MHNDFRIYWFVMQSGQNKATLYLATQTSGSNDKNRRFIQTSHQLCIITSNQSLTHSYIVCRLIISKLSSKFSRFDSKWRWTTQNLVLRINKGKVIHVPSKICNQWSWKKIYKRFVFIILFSRLCFSLLQWQKISMKSSTLCMVLQERTTQPTCTNCWIHKKTWMPEISTRGIQLWEWNEIWFPAP